MIAAFSGVRLVISWVLDITGVKVGWDIVDGVSDGAVDSCCFFVAFGEVAAVWVFILL